MPTTKATYEPIDTEPSVLRWDVPARHSGQIVEVAYAATTRATADVGAPYKRVTDRAVAPGRPGRVTYYRRVVAS